MMPTIRALRALRDAGDLEGYEVAYRHAGLTSERVVRIASVGTLRARREADRYEADLLRRVEREAR